VAAAERNARDGHHHRVAAILALRERFYRANVGERRIIGAERQYTDVSGSGFQMRIDSIANLFLIAPRHDRIDQPIAASEDARALGGAG